MTVAAVAATEGWLCHLCGGEIDPTVRSPDPRSATVDHVIPLRAGGTDDPGNTRLAHFACNRLKGAKLPL